ncbi:MAG: PIN domain-containing protein [Kineosporiaceae bacterium]
MTTTGPRHLVLDTGALLGVELAAPRVRALLREAAAVGCRFTVPAGVVAQAWRGGPRQATVARLLSDRSVAVAELDGATARAVGVLSGRSGHPDVVDVHVALTARQLDALVVTSDPDDIRRVDPSLDIVGV